MHRSPAARLPRCALGVAVGMVLSLSLAAPPASPFFLIPNFLAIIANGFRMHRSAI